MEKSDRVFVAGHKGMIGSAIERRLRETGFANLATRSGCELDLTDQKSVVGFFLAEKPDYVFLAVTTLGGILANSRYPATFIYNNIQSQTNVIQAAWKTGVRKLLYLASSCIYPRECPQPMKEEYLMSGKLEPTSEPYAVAKIAGIRMCQSYDRQYQTRYISVVPADLYGPNDDFDPETGHVLPALMAKMHRAKVRGDPELAVWGTGSPRRECLHVDDLADACIFLMDRYDEPEMINVGSGQDMSIRELALLLRQVVGFRGIIAFDESKPDAVPHKLPDTSKISKLGWSPRIHPQRGLRQTYQWYPSHLESA
ncbi:MAG: GDP-L-fucose synthase [Chloroflexi bacterium]|nr:GDP-L-fucose synthase [Chloroflexota bacterium]